MRPIAAKTMTKLLTQPYRRGGETLDIPIGADAGGFTTIPAYTFREYHARWGHDPAAPKYVIYPLVKIPDAGVQLDIRFQIGGAAEQAASVTIPGGTFPGTSFAIPIPGNADATLALTRFRQLPMPLPGAGQANFAITALLGNVAKLAWVLGWEKDQIRRNMEDIERQRHVAFAHDSSLDALGADLRVPRFPPRAYGFDADTIALYHFDAIVANGGAVLDETVRFGLPGHPGVNQNAITGVAAKFGNGFRFPGTGGAGAVEIPSSPAFDLPANANFTVEIFAKADSAAGPSLVVGKGTLDAGGALTAAGWSLMLGTFRGIPNNLRFAINDGANALEIFADENLADGQFHHFAAHLDRASRQARLFVDGALKTSADIANIGAITNAQTIRVGRSLVGHQISAIVDELRLSSAARTSFDPVLGEGDESYRQRLAIFRRWQLPTPGGVIDTINSVVQINGQPDSFVLIEQTRPIANATAMIRIVPAALNAKQSIAANGDMQAKENAAPDDDFRDIFLVKHSDARVNYGANPNNARMRAVTAKALDQLLSLISSVNPPIAGRVVIAKSYDPNDSGLHSVGRALRITHESLTLPQLGVFAHRAGFDFVRNDSTAIYCSVKAGEKLAMTIEARAAAEIPGDGSDLFAGHVMNVHIAQDLLPASGIVQWVVIPCGNGRVTLLPHPADPNTLTTPVVSRRRLQIRADVPGDLTIRVEYSLDGVTVTGTRTVKITIDSLADGAAITADGSFTKTEAQSSGAVPAAALNTDYLIAPALAINFGADPNNKKTQIAIERRLITLTTLLAAAGGAVNQLQIVKSFAPADATLHKVGRAIQFTHPAFDAGKLAALAHQAGFDFVQRNGTTIYASVAEDSLIDIAQAPGLTPLPVDLPVNTPINLRARFTTLPAAGTYNWSTVNSGNGAGSFDFVLRPAVTFTPKKTGVMALNLTYSEADAAKVTPYTFEIRLKPALDVPGTIIPKTKYDLLMNILNYFHPIGVEVITKNVREHVVEVKDNLLSAFPGYTYPDFRV